MQLQEILMTAHRQDASDVHLVSGHPPIMRVHTVITPMDLPMLTPKSVKEYLAHMIGDEQLRRFEEVKDLDFSHEVQGLGRTVHITFCVEADGGEMTVALASMVSKYLREALMSEWNAYWQKEVPDIKPTAGYPGDARRFYDEILPALRRMDLKEDQVWRKR